MVFAISCSIYIGQLIESIAQHILGSWLKIFWCEFNLCLGSSMLLLQCVLDRACIGSVLCFWARVCLVQTCFGSSTSAASAMHIVVYCWCLRLCCGDTSVRASPWLSLGNRYSCSDRFANADTTYTWPSAVGLCSVGMCPVGVGRFWMYCTHVVVCFDWCCISWCNCIVCLVDVDASLQVASRCVCGLLQIAMYDYSSRVLQVWVTDCEMGLCILLIAHWGTHQVTMQYIVCYLLGYTCGCSFCKFQLSL